MPSIILDSNKLKAASKFLTYSLLVALPLILHTNVLAQRAIPLTPTVSQSANSSEDSIVKKLMGEWENKDSLGTNVNFIFGGDGKMFLIMEVGEKSAAYPLKYTIDSTKSPMYLDIKLPDSPKPVLTIFDFTEDGKMRMQIEGTNPGEPRPSNFSADVSVFNKVAENTTLPENIELIDPSLEKPINSPEDEAKQTIRTMNSAQQTYFLDVNKFAKTIQELKVSIESENNNYRYRIFSQGKDGQNIIHTATAKKPNLKSYTGIVFTRKVKGESFTNVAICETVNYANDPPRIINIPRKVSQQFQCPSDSILLQ
jgi:hypothetical protein